MATLGLVATGGRRAGVNKSSRSALGRVPYGFVLPALLIYSVVVLYPNAAAAVYAFTDWTGGTVAPAFIGLDNFRRLLTEPEAITALTHTLIIAAAVTVIQTVVGLALAVALNRPLRSRVILRGLFFLPVLLPPVVVAFLWQYILTPTGPLNSALGAVGLRALERNWLGDSSIALGSVIGVIIWQNVGISMVVFLAGLQTVPPELTEAAQLDGATAIQRFRFVTLPLLLPSTTIVLTVTLISSLKIFDQVFVLTGGGPGYATQTMSLFMYRTAFVSLDFGYSTAIALVLTAVIFVLAMLQTLLLQRRQATT